MYAAIGNGKVLVHILGAPAEIDHYSPKVYSAQFNNPKPPTDPSFCALHCYRIQVNTSSPKNYLALSRERERVETICHTGQKLELIHCPKMG